jgi:hypothetical protein
MSKGGDLQAPSTTINELATILNHLPTHFDVLDVFLDSVEPNEFVELFDYPFDSHFEPMPNIELFNS